MWHQVDFEELPRDQVRAIPFKDKKREASRQARLAKAKPEAEVQAEREQRAKDRAKEQKLIQKERSRREKQSVRERHTEHRSHEMNELNKEARLIKKLRAGKITEKQLEAEMKAWRVGANANEEDDFFSTAALEEDKEVVPEQQSDESDEEIEEEQLKPSVPSKLALCNRQPIPGELRPSAQQLERIKQLAKLKREEEGSDSDSFDEDNDSEEEAQPAKATKGTAMDSDIPMRDRRQGMKGQAAGAVMRPSAKQLEKIKQLAKINREQEGSDSEDEFEELPATTNTNGKAAKRQRSDADLRPSAKQLETIKRLAKLKQEEEGSDSDTAFDENGADSDVEQPAATVAATTALQQAPGGKKKRKKARGKRGGGKKKQKIVA